MPGTLDWLAIAGPTASGKTALALALAQQRPVEIISVDSALVYRGMDIGTAKPSPDEQAQVPHHLIDIKDPADSYSAAAFVRDATACLHAIRARGRLPVLVGGTMLYLKALLEGLDDMPAADPQVRARIDAEAAIHGWPALHATLAQVDPVTAQRLQPNDAQRISRALEVFRTSGQPLSGFHTRLMPSNHGEVPTHAQQSIKGRPHTLTVDGLTGHLVSLEPIERAWLHARIDVRFRHMLAHGLIDEVRALKARQNLHAKLPSMRCVGYRQVWDALDRDPTGQAYSAAQAQEALAQQGIAATRQLAKRQLTWLRSMPYRTVVACDSPQALAHALDRIESI